MPEPSELVVRLRGDGIDNADAGGKGSALDRLISLEANVPTTSVVTTAAYRRFVSDPALSTLLDELITGDVPAPEQHPDEQERVDQAFLQVELPPALVDAIAQWGPDIGGASRIAVRSSATAEDTASASFAGQYRSYLNVGPDTLHDSVRLVWASLWHPAPRSYRRFRHIPEDELSMAVVLMAMLDPSHAGVLFTADPTGSEDRLRLEVVEGLGEALVSGEATPEAYVLPRTDAEGTLAEINPVFADLIAEGARLEGLLGAPQDIEWAIDNGELFLVQARPVTTGTTGTGTDDGFDVNSGDDARYTTAGIGETLPGVLPPLDWDINSWLLENGFRELFDSLGGYPDGLVAPHALIGRFRARAALNLDVMQQAAGSIPGASPEELEHQYFGEAMSTEVEPPPTKPATGAARQGVRTLRARQRAAQEAEIVIRAVEMVVDNEPDLLGLDDEDLLGYRSRLLHIASRAVAAEVTVAAMATASYRSIEVFLGNHIGQADASRGAQLMTSGSGGSRRASIALAMGTLAEEARSVPALQGAVMADEWTEAETLLGETDEGRDLLARLHFALARAGSTSYFGGPTWAEVPHLGWLAFRKELSKVDEPDHDASRSEARREIEARLVSDPHWSYARWASGQLFDIRRRFFRREAADAAEFLDRREHTKAAMLMLGGALRRANIELGRRLCAAGLLEEPDDVLLVGNSGLLDLVRSVGPTPDVIAFRRRRLAEAALDGPLPRLFQGSPEAADRPVLVGHHVEGWGASPGRYEGPARVVRSIESSGMVRGDVLVATATDASWAPLFMIAGAIVVEEGGPLSHAAIVARELGMPAVVNVPGIMDRIESEPGPVSLTVDGTSGDVVIHTDDSADPVPADAIDPTPADPTPADPDPADPDLGAGVAPLRQPAETTNQLDRLNVFVTGLIGASALFSTVIALTESRSSTRGRYRLYRRAFPIATTLSAGVTSGFQGPEARYLGIRPRSHYIVGTLLLALTAIGLGIVSTNAFLADDSGTSGSVFFWALSMASAATLAMVAIYGANAAVTWPIVLPTVRRLAPSRPHKENTWPGAIGTRRLLVVYGLLGVVAILGLIAIFFEGVLLEIDERIYENIGAGKDVDRYGPDFLNLLGRPIVIIPLALAIGLASIRCRVIALAFPMAVVAAGISNLLLGWIVRRDRPPLSVHVGEVTSFPGGHFMQMTLLFGVLPVAAYIVSGRPDVRNTVAVLSAALLAVVLTDTFRTGGHWPTDQLAGLLIGLALVIVIWGLRAPSHLHDSCNSSCPSAAQASQPS